MHNFHETIETIQRNCHIADANHAREMTMCNYLLGMREYFRWENELPLTQPPPRQEIGEWLTQREALWDSLEKERLPARAGGKPPLRPLRHRRHQPGHR